MGSGLSRRQFFGCSMVGGALLTMPMALSRAALVDEGFAAPRKVKIHTVFVGRTGDIYLSRPTEEVGRLQDHLKQIEAGLGDVEFVGGEFVPETAGSDVVAKLSEADGVILFHLSGHGGGAPAEAMQQIVDYGLPTAVFSQPFSGHGWMYFPQWKKDGKNVVLLATSDWSELDRVAGLMRVAPHLRDTRILVVRGPLGTAPACAYDRIQERLGAQVIPVSVDDTLAAFEAVDPAEAENEAEQYWLNPAKAIVEPTRQEIVDATRFYLAIKKMMIESKACAVTSSNCMGAPAKGCLAFSKLNDLGCVGACEGDMDSTLTMLMYQYAFGIPGFISDPVFDTARNALIHFHCTSATKMDGVGGERHPFTIRTQTDSGRGVALDVEMRVGEDVTCAKFINLDTMLVSTGKIVEVSHDPLGCRTQFITEVADARKMFENWGGGVLEGDTMTLLHRVVFYGNHRKSMDDLGSLMGFRVVDEA